MCFGVGLEIVARVSNGMAVMSRVVKVLCAVVLGCGRLVLVVVFRR